MLGSHELTQNPGGSVSESRPGVLKRNCSFQGQLIGQCVAAGLIKAKTKVSRCFYTQPVQKKVLELCKIKPAENVTIGSV